MGEVHTAQEATFRLMIRPRILLLLVLELSTTKNQSQDPLHHPASTGATVASFAPSVTRRSRLSSRMSGEVDVSHCMVEAAVIPEADPL